MTTELKKLSGLCARQLESVARPSHPQASLLQQGFCCWIPYSQKINSADKFSMSKSSNKNMWINNEQDVTFVFALAKQYCRADKCTISCLWRVGSYTPWTGKGYSREVQQPVYWVQVLSPFMQCRQVFGWQQNRWAWWVVGLWCLNAVFILRLYARLSWLIFSRVPADHNITTFMAMYHSSLPDQTVFPKLSLPRGSFCIKKWKVEPSILEEHGGENSTACLTNKVNTGFLEQSRSSCDMLWAADDT